MKLAFALLRNGDAVLTKVRQKAGVTGRWHDNRHTLVTELVRATSSRCTTRADRDLSLVLLGAAIAAPRNRCRAAAFAAYPLMPHIKIEDGKGRRLGRLFGVKLWPTLVFLNNGKEIARLVRPVNSTLINEALAKIA
jgi:hypothetical protein